MENPVKMDDLGVPLFSETPIYQSISPIDPCPAVSSLGWTASNHRSVKDEPISKALKGEGSYVQYFLGD